MASDTKRPSISTVGDRCCGCGACAAACPVSCLAMEPDSCGFVRPAYETGCIGCGRCAKACPVLSASAKDDASEVLWAKAKDDSLRMRSSSGSVFGLLAKRVLDVGGTVYGAAFAEGCLTVSHVRVDSEDNLDTVMRSKYVQSSVGVEVYEGVEGDLRDGRKVLFSGTACQVAAMRNYLALKKVPADGLLLVEVVCHGAPSPRLWSEWLGHVSGGSGGITEVSFRDKSTGWSNYSVRYGAQGGSDRLVNHEDDWYMKAFLRNASLRQSCLDCPAKRCCGSDVTLGDFWGIQRISPEAAADDMGVSAVICNTARGVAAIRGIAASLDVGPSAFDEVIADNPSVVRSSEPYPKRDAFLTDVDGGMPIEKLTKRWTFEPSLKQKVHRYLSRVKRCLSGGHKRD